MKKSILALALCAALCLAVLPAESGAAFTDISDDTTQIAAAALQGLGVVSGTSGATFSPDETLTRAQMCAMAVNAMGLSDQVSTGGRKSLFSDVSPSAWYNGYVNVAYGEGLINGYGNGTFGPDDPVTYGQVATVLLRMLGYTSAEVGSLWPLDYTDFCDGLGLSQGLALAPNDSLTRGDALSQSGPCWRTSTGRSSPTMRPSTGWPPPPRPSCWTRTRRLRRGSGLLMAYLPDGSGITYYTQGRQQSDALEGRLGALLFDGAGRAVGFVPGEGEARDVTIGSATASTLTASNGSSYRISSGAVVLSGSETYDYSTSGYLQLNKPGRVLRPPLCRRHRGHPLPLPVQRHHQRLPGRRGDTSSRRQLPGPGPWHLRPLLRHHQNGAAASSGDLAEYDVAYYDAATGTMRASDYKVTGYISAAQPQRHRRRDHHRGGL